MARWSFGDFLFGQARDAVADIRSKVILEGWFGRRPETPSHGAEALGWTQPQPLEFKQPSFEQDWQPRRATAHDPEADRNHERDVDRGIDR